MSLNILLGVLSIVVPIGAQQWYLHRQYLKERQREAREIAEAITLRDKKLGIILDEYTLHKHTEKKESEILTRNGIEYTKAAFNGRHSA